MRHFKTTENQSASEQAHSTEERALKLVKKLQYQAQILPHLWFGMSSRRRRRRKAQWISSNDTGRRGGCVA